MPRTVVPFAHRKNKVTRLIVPFLYENPGATINDVIDPDTGSPVEALYFYQGLRQNLIVQQRDDVKSGERGRPAKRWNLSKGERDRIRKQRNRAAKANEPVATPEPALV